MVTNLSCVFLSLTREQHAQGYIDADVQIGLEILLVLKSLIEQAVVPTL
jgi:hypothetical protein